jgi:hypothetical protein
MLMGLLTLLFHGRLIVGPSDQLIATADIGYYFHWLHQYTRDQFLAGHIPLWNPYSYCGMPFAANPQATVFYPLSWLHLLFPVLQAERLMIVLHGLLAGSFMYGFLREVRVRPEAAIVGSVPFMFGNYMMANAGVGHLTMVFTVTWLPLALLFLERAIARQQFVWMVLTGLILGVQALAGEPQNSYYTGLLLAVYAIVRTCADRSLRQRASWTRIQLFWLAGLLVAAIVAVSTAAVQLFPTLEFARLSDRSGNSFEFATFISYKYQTFAEFLIPFHSGSEYGIALRKPMIIIQQNWEFAGYVGILTLVLAGLSFVRPRSSSVWCAWIVLPLALVLLLGGNTPIYRLLYEVVPGLKLFRIPARAVVLVHWSLCTMTAFGAEGVLDSAERSRGGQRGRLICISLVVAAGLAVVAAVQFLGLHRAVADQTGTESLGTPLSLNDPAIIRTLLCLSLTFGVLLILKWLPVRFIGCTLIVAICIDLCIQRPRLNLMTYSAAGDPSLNAIQEIKSQARTVSSPYRADLPPDLVVVNSGLVSKVEYVNGYSPLSIGRFYRFVHWMRGMAISQNTRHQLPDAIYRTANPFALELLNVRIAAQWRAAQGKYDRLVHPHPLPRAWLVDQAEIIGDEQQTLDRLKQPAFSPRTTVVLVEPAQLSLTHTDVSLSDCHIKRVNDQHLRIECDASRNCILVLSEIYYPGWRALVDGQPTALVRANYTLTALELPRGKHTVEYVYKPASFTIGCIWTIFSLLAATALFIIQFRSRHASRAAQL